MLLATDLSKKNLFNPVSEVKGLSLFSQKRIGPE